MGIRAKAGGQEGSVGSLSFESRQPLHPLLLVVPLKLGVEVGGHDHEVDQRIGIAPGEVVVAVRAREFRGSIEVAGGAVEPCARIECFWRVREVGQSRTEVPDLPCLTDSAAGRVIGSRCGSASPVSTRRASGQGVTYWNGEDHRGGEGGRPFGRHGPRRPKRSGSKTVAEGPVSTIKGTRTRPISGTSAIQRIASIGVGATPSARPTTKGPAAAR